MNTDCIWYYEERDVNWRQCKHPDHEEDDDCEDCRDYYTKDDAKADWRSKDEDRY